MPLTLDRGARPVNSHYLSAIARLRPGVTSETAQAELRQLTSTLPEVFPEAYSPGFMARYGFDMARQVAQDRSRRKCQSVAVDRDGGFATRSFCGCRQHGRNVPRASGRTPA